MKKNYTILSLALLLSMTCFSHSHAENRIQFEDERKLAKNIRLAATAFQTIARPEPKPFPFENEEEQEVANFAGSFIKSFDHDPETGVLTPSAQESYKKLLLALHTGLQKYYNEVKLSPQSTRKFVNPQSGYTFSLEGCDSALFTMLAPPRLSSAWAAADLTELYLEAICRDVQFQDYGTGAGTDANGSGGSLTVTASRILNAFGKQFHGPRNKNGQVDPSVLFRGNDKGSLIGPYVSQFLLLPTFKVFQPLLKQNQYVPIAQQREFGVSWKDFIAIQNGTVPKPYDQYDFDQEHLRYIIMGRDFGTYVHLDGPYEIYFYAANVLMANKFPLAPNLPYQNGSIKNEDPFNSMGMPELFEILGNAADEGLKAAWCQKWRICRRLRPEEMAGLAHRVKVTGENPYNLNDLLFNQPSGVDVLAMVLEHNLKQATLEHNSIPADQAVTYLLSQMYPEGSPIHSSYPSGHAVMAGACITVIKAFVDDEALIKNFVIPVKPDPADPTQLIALSGEDENRMTVASELNKLASNIAMGRNWAGIHYRSDGDLGILLGEEVAIRLLEDRARIYTEQGFKGFELTKVNGQRIKITANGTSSL